MAEDPKWKKFEKLVHKIQQDLAPGADVKFNDKIHDSDADTMRQVDISIRAHVGQFPLLIIIECKDHKVPVDITIVESFISKVAKLKANKGAIIPASGFTEAAIATAKKSGINTYTVADGENTNWQEYVQRIPLLVERVYIDWKSTGIKFKNCDAALLSLLPENKSEIEVFKGQKRVGTIHSLVAKKWNAGEIERVPGEHIVTIGQDYQILLNGSLHKVDMEMKLIAKIIFYTGLLPFFSKGFIDEQDKKIHFSEMKSIEATLPDMINLHLKDKLVSKDETEANNRYKSFPAKMRMGFRIVDDIPEK